MLQDCVARTTLPALDIERAKRFYGETLGLSAVLETPGGVVYQTEASDNRAPAVGWSGQSTFLVFPTPNPSRGGHTQMGFLVTDIAAAVAELRKKGIAFEEYDLPDLKTDNGIATILNGRGKAAWFKDSEGNTIGLVQFNS